MTSSRSSLLDAALTDLLRQAPEVEAAAVVSFDGLPMASALPATMDEDRVAAMSAALLSLGERAAQGLGRGDLSQVYIEGENGTVFLVSADDEAVLVAVAARGAKVGMMLYEVRRSAVAVASALRAEEAAPVAAPEHSVAAHVDPAVVAVPPAHTAPPVQHVPVDSLPAYGGADPGVGSLGAASVLPASAGAAHDPLVAEGGGWGAPTAWNGQATGNGAAPSWS